MCSFTIQSYSILCHRAEQSCQPGVIPIRKLLPHHHHTTTTTPPYVPQLLRAIQYYDQQYYESEKVKKSMELEKVKIDQISHNSKEIMIVQISNEIKSSDNFK